MNRFPLARSDVAVQATGEELLIYDPADDQAHCLNALASSVWKLCDGRTSLAQIAAIVCRKLDIPVDSQVVELALQELSQLKLLQNAAVPSSAEKLYTRRYLAGRLAGTAAGIVLGTLVVSARARAQATPSAPRPTTTAPPPPPPPPD